MEKKHKTDLEQATASNVAYARKYFKRIEAILIPTPNGSKTAIEVRLFGEDGYQIRGYAEGEYGEFPDDILTIVNKSFKNVLLKENN